MHVADLIFEVGHGTLRGGGVDESLSAHSSACLSGAGAPFFGKEAGCLGRGGRFLKLLHHHHTRQEKEKRRKTHHNLHTNHTINPSLPDHHSPEVNILQGSIDQGILAVHAQLGILQSLQEAVSKSNIWLDTIDMLNLGGIEPIQLVPRPGAQVNDDAVRGGDELRDGAG